MTNAIILTLKDEFTEQEVKREIGINSEFNTDGLKYQKAFIDCWINERGNDQHNSILTCLSWEYKN